MKTSTINAVKSYAKKIQVEILDCQSLLSSGVGYFVKNSHMLKRQKHYRGRTYKF